jgi:hypothetical protein
LGITRATKGQVRCPWCARPVPDGPDRPDVCPSCGIPLARPSSGAIQPFVVRTSAARAQRAQRLRAVATILALTSALLLITATAVAVPYLRQDRADKHATDNLMSVLRAAEQIRRDTGQFLGAQPVALDGKVFGIHVVDALTPSNGPALVSMVVSSDAWYGAVRSSSGHCYAAATLNGNPLVVRAVLPGNCTGDAARATLVPPPSGAGATITAGPAAGNTTPVGGSGT